ncbi:hypothetical protein [Streptobacillus canis]|uniref:hypothetical protein n=1 Tax=Streptobacillus canis TaxID=2678686 RepID=UPI0012E2F333|nr:hypothetical protein [Streptobacillus canis]
MDNKVVNQKYTPSLTIDYGYKDMLSITNTLENRQLVTDLNLNLKYKKLYSNIGFNTDYKIFTPKVSLGVNFDISRLNIDTSIEYNKKFRALFALKFNIVR